MGKQAERVRFKKGGKVVWIRKITKRERGGPHLPLPAEFRDWGGREVEIEPISDREIIVRLVKLDDINRKEA